MGDRKGSVRPERVKVPDIEHPLYCYKQCNPDASQPELFKHAMARCLYPKGHKGPHQWMIGND